MAPCARGKEFKERDSALFGSFLLIAITRGVLTVVGIGVYRGVVTTGERIALGRVVFGGTSGA